GRGPSPSRNHAQKASPRHKQPQPLDLSPDFSPRVPPKGRPVASESYERDFNRSTAARRSGESTGTMSGVGTFEPSHGRGNLMGIFPLPRFALKSSSLMSHAARSAPVGTYFHPRNAPTT